MNETIDFSNTELPKENGKFLLPGMYWVKLKDATFITSSKKGTPGMEVVLECVSNNPDYNGRIAKHKFWLTANNMPRINYFHKAFYDKTIDKKFNSWEDLCSYFKLVLSSDKGKLIKKPFIVGGSISDDGTKLYSDLPYTGYLVNEEDFEEGSFAINGQLFKENITSVTKVFVEDKPSNDSDIINSNSPWNSEGISSTPLTSPTSNDESEADLPF